jgi:hypothetical protein
MSLRPGNLRPREAPPVPEQEFREPMARPQEIRTDVFATAQRITRPIALDRYRSIRQETIAG